MARRRGTSINLTKTKVARNFDFQPNAAQKFTAATLNIPTSFHPTAGASQLTFQRPSAARPEDILIFNTIDRDETQEELEERKAKEEEEKKKNKKGGKVEETEQGPRKIKQCVQSNINLQGVYPRMSRWIASCFQLIKDASIIDVNTKEKLWSKIYPQNAEGIPVYNPSGKYWVKLYFQGKSKKVEVDDQFLYFNGQPVFPRCTNQNLLWPMLFTKALIRLQKYFPKAAKTGTTSC